MTLIFHNKHALAISSNDWTTKNEKFDLFITFGYTYSSVIELSIRNMGTCVMKLA
jgi:hypothetical protein